MKNDKTFTHLGKFLVAQYAKQGMTAAEMADRMDFDPVILSKIKNGKQIYIDSKTLRKMVVGISEDFSVREQLVVAYLSDLRDNIPGIEPKNIVIRSKNRSIRIEESPKPIGESHASLVKSGIEYDLNTSEIQLVTDLIAGMKADKAVYQTIQGLVTMISD